MEILKKTGKFLLGVVIGVAIMMFADRYYVKGKRLSPITCRKNR